MAGSGNVFVFGAGVSKPAGFPLASDLTSLLREWLPETSVAVWDALVADGVLGPETDLETSLTHLDLRIASLTPEQRRLLELRMQRQAKVDPSKPRPLPRAAGPNAL